jgi:hypothetical protein
MIIILVISTRTLLLNRIIPVTLVREVILLGVIARILAFHYVFCLHLVPLIEL